MNYKIGLDIGIASVGWAVISMNETGNSQRIEDMGVRIFDCAEAKTGDSLAAPRREARSAGRRLRRHKHRLERIKYLIEKNHIMTRCQIEAMYQNPTFEKSVYQLRSEALDRVLSREEFCRVLINLAQRRGYKSNSKSEESKQKDTGKALTAISENEKLMIEKGYKTIGQMLWLDDKFKYIGADGKRHLCTRNYQDDYKFTMPRALLKKEIAEIFKVQRALGSEFAKEETEKKYIEIFSSQRNFDQGPGGSSRYRGNKIEQMLGTCTFEKDEPRAVRASYSFEYFRLLQDLNNIKIKQIGEIEQPLTPEQKETIKNLVLKSDNISYAKIRKCLNLNTDQYFNMVWYSTKSDKNNNDELSAEKMKFNHMQSYHKIRKALPSEIQLTWEQTDEIAEILTLYKNDEQRTNKLKALGFSEKEIMPLLELPFSKAGHLSIKALKKIIPLLEQGLRYDQACKEIYGEYNRTDKLEKLCMSDKDFKNDILNITNPVVRRATVQTIKVVNAIIDKYGSPSEICIETTRELKNNYKEREKIKKSQDENRSKNEKAKKQIEEYKKDATGQDIVKYKLWQEQGEHCIYSGEKITINELFTKGFCEVDHIIPYSLCFDDSYKNKVLVKAKENQMKGNRIPFDYFGSDAVRWETFVTRVNTMIKDRKKRERLLKTKFTEENQADWISRNLNDTAYATRIIRDIFDNYLKFASTDNRKHVRAVSGAITAYLRKRLGINKVREDGDLHHAVDAAVIATVSDGIIQKITKYSQALEVKYMINKPVVDQETGELLNYETLEDLPKYIEPMPKFRKQIEARLAPNSLEVMKELKLSAYEDVTEMLDVFVSRKPTRKITGEAHEATIRSAKKEKDGYVVSKVQLTSLKLDKNGEIKYGNGGRIYNEHSDKLLYDAIKKRLQQFDGNGKEAFKEFYLPGVEGFRKPKKDGTPGPIVRKVKIEEKSTDNVKTDRGIADNGKMIRIDVFYVDGKGREKGYYFVPIYVRHTICDKLPNKACVQNKPVSEWKEMYNKNFIFSLYPLDKI